MNITKDELKAWVDVPERGRHWLAEKCGVHYRTVGNWITSANQGIPDAKMRIITRLMAEDAARESVTDIPSALVLHWTKEEFRIIQEAARAANMLVDEWAEKELLDIAKEPATKPAEIDADSDISALSDSVKAETQHPNTAPKPSAGQES